MFSFRNMVLKYKWFMTGQVILSFITGITVIIQAYLIVSVIDQVFLQNVPFSNLIWPLAALLLVLLLRTGSAYMNDRIGIKIAANAKADYRYKLLNKYASTPLMSASQGQSGGKISLLMDAVDKMDSYFSSYIPQLIRTSIIPSLILIIAFMHHPNTGWIMLITAPFIPIVMIVVGLQTKSKSAEQQDKLSAFSGKFLDKLQGLVTLKLFGQADKQAQMIKNNSLNFRDTTMQILKIAFTSSFMLELIAMLGIGIVALELSIQLIIYEQISFFTAFFLLVLAPEFYSTLRELGSTFHNGQSSIGAAQKVIDALDEPTQSVQWGNETLSGKQTPPAIHLEDVHFQYDNQGFSLNHITAKIDPYDNIAIVGKTGSGKTTLLHLIAGLLPIDQGRIAINHLSLASYKESDWFNQLSYISQQPYIFSGTIAENIAIGTQANVSRSEIEDAAKKAGLTDLIHSLDNGYKTQVGEAGRGLSGGEQQRLALARAFLKRPSVVLFDEPTTGLDLKTEEILQQSINQLSKQATMITVAHRLHTIKHADKMLFLESGTLAGSGTHEELLESIPAYRNMVNAQRGVRTT